MTSFFPRGVAKFSFEGGDFSVFLWRGKALVLHPYLFISTYENSTKYFIKHPAVRKTLGFIHYLGQIKNGPTLIYFRIIMIFN